MHISTDKQDWDVLLGTVKVKPVFSIWLVLFLLLLIVALIFYTNKFLKGELPWTPQMIFDAIIVYLQGL